MRTTEGIKNIIQFPDLKPYYILDIELRSKKRHRIWEAIGLELMRIIASFMGMELEMEIRFGRVRNVGNNYY